MSWSHIVKNQHTLSHSHSHSHSGDSLQYYYLCPTGIDPVVPWFRYVFDFVLGKGIFNDTILFHGRYTNETVQVIGSTKYNLPVAYLLLTGAVFLMCVVLLVYK